MRSMTGFGQASWQSQGRKIVVEVRSVNQRFLEARFNLPREYVSCEAELRQILQAEVGRGKVDVNVNRSGVLANEVAVEVNTALARAYADAWRRLQRTLQIPGTIDLLGMLARADVVRAGERRGDATVELPQLQRVFRAALRNFNREREREGRALAADMRRRVQRLLQLAVAMQRRVAAALPELNERLRQRVAALLNGASVDQQRLAQEVAFIAGRSDITEELVRLQTHLTAFRALCASREPAGKRADFLLQEIHREVNTIGSKSNDLQLTDLMLEAKAEIEKLREQVQNIE